MNETTTVSEFVMSLWRLYKNCLITDAFIERLLKNKKITPDNYSFIINGKEA